MGFLRYWDTRIDANERFFNANPGVANFAFSECQRLWEYMEEENKVLRAMLFGAQTQRDAARAEQCTSPWPDSPPCRGIQKQLDRIKKLEGSLRMLIGCLEDFSDELEAARKVLENP